jgi:hypothetical protein
MSKTEELQKRDAVCQERMAKSVLEASSSWYSRLSFQCSMALHS